MVLTIRLRTQSVMPIGTHSSRPVTKYRFNMLLDIARAGMAAAGRPAAAGQPAPDPPAGALSVERPAWLAAGAGATAGRGSGARDGGLAVGWTSRLLDLSIGLVVRLVIGLVIGLPFAVARRLGGIARLLAVVTEVGDIPAGAFQLERGSRQLPGERFGAAGRADGKRRVRHFLQHVLLVAAGVATVGIDRHDRNGSEVLRC